MIQLISDHAGLQADAAILRIDIDDRGEMF